jgi:muramoyltetrapeptide carboxypeptidase
MVELMGSGRGGVGVPRAAVKAVWPVPLEPGDRVRLVSPASPVSADRVGRVAAVLEGLGLRVELGAHVHDVADDLDYLAGRDEDRLADLNDALRDPGVKAIVATRGGKGAYRVAAGLDVVAARRHPKLVVGFSEITILHMALFRHAGLVSLHGAPWGTEEFGSSSADSFAEAVTSTTPVVVHARPAEPTHALTTQGRAVGRLLGGNQDSIATAAGWAMPDLAGAILLLEAYNLRLGHIDRQLTMLFETGIIRHVAGVAVGQYTRCGAASDPSATSLACSEVDVLRDRLGRLGVPILGGLPISHGDDPAAVPIGTLASLHADEGTLTVDAAVRRTASARAAGRSAHTGPVH